MKETAYFWGFGALAALYIISVIASFKNHKSKAFYPWSPAFGANNEISTSQLQFLVFTWVVVFAFCTTYGARFAASKSIIEQLPQIPVNLMLLMGLSVTTTATSKAITVSYISQGDLSPEDNSNLLNNRDGSTGLTKIQMLIWTLISAIIYLITFNKWLAGTDFATLTDGMALPDIDTTLLVLMGIAQGGYVGGKLVSKSPGNPIIDRLLSTQAKAGDTVKIIGIRFGNHKDGYVIYADTLTPNVEKELTIDPANWIDSEISFSVGSEFESDKEYNIQVRSGGFSSNVKTLKIIPTP